MKSRAKEFRSQERRGRADLSSGQLATPISKPWTFKGSVGLEGWRGDYQGGCSVTVLVVGGWEVQSRGFLETDQSQD